MLYRKETSSGDVQELVQRPLADAGPRRSRVRVKLSRVRLDSARSEMSHSHVAERNERFRVLGVSGLAPCALEREQPLGLAVCHRLSALQT